MRTTLEYLALRATAIGWLRSRAGTSPMIYGREMQFMTILSVLVLGGCASDTASREAAVERLLARGDYDQAIIQIERGPNSAEWRFSLGLLYAFREIEERRERADFTKAIQTIRSAAPEKEEARQLLADYERRGAQVFFTFPWAHMIGPFPDRRRPEPEKKGQPVGAAIPVVRRHGMLAVK